MDAPLKKIEEILKELGPDWYAVDKLYSSPQIELDPTNKVIPNSNLVVLKFFKNSKTGEIKSYLAKNLDISEREKL